MGDVYTKTFKSDGIGGLYRGFVDSLKPVLLPGELSNNFAATFALGYGVTVVSGLISYPLDTIRRRMMMTSGEAVKYKNSLDCAAQVMKKEGFSSFFKGAGALAGFDKLKAFYIDWRFAE